MGLREISGHLAADRTGQITAWYLLAPQPWSFRSDDQRTILVMGAAARYTALRGRQVHVRVTTSPYPIHRWAKALDDNTPQPLGGNGRGSAWDERLVRAQDHLSAMTMADKRVYLGVSLARQSGIDRLMRMVLRQGVDNEQLRDDVALVDEIVAGQGMEGRPVLPDEMEWLLRRSLGLGLPSVGALAPHEHPEWDTDDLHAITDRVTVEPKPLSRTTRMVGEDGQERHVAVLSIGRVDQIDVPDASRVPWMSQSDRLPFPVEWSCRVDMLSGADLAGKVNARLLVGRDMQRQYAQHDMLTPPDVARKVQIAQDVQDQMRTGTEEQAARAYGWYRLAVSAETEKECLKRVRAVQDEYRRTQVSVEHPRGQVGLLREFLPGEPLSTTAHKRRLPVIYHAAGLPTASSTLGDKRGPYRGYTVGGSQRPVMLDPHYGPEIRESSGLVPVVGTLGSGKSGVLASIAWDEFEAGVPVTIWDPSGPLANLVDLAHERHGKHTARHLNLMRAEPGRLSPYSIINEPVRDHYPLEQDYQAAKVEAEQERKSLVLDVCRMLTWQIGDESRSRKALMRAIRATGGRRGGSLMNVVDALRQNTEDHVHADSIADVLMDAYEHPMSRLYFGNGIGLEGEDDNRGLTVITMAGINKPDPTLPREQWGQDQILAQPLLSLAIYHTSRRIYSGRMKDRVCVALDEAHVLSDWASGKTLLRRLATDSRKHNAAVIAASQNAGHVLSLDVENLIGAAIVGRTEDAGHAAEALRLLRVPTGAGYERVLQSLSARDPRSNVRSGFREFVVRDNDGQVEKMRWDLSHNPALMAAIDTTADPYDRHRAELVAA